MSEVLGADELRALLAYDGSTGVFTWRICHKRRPNQAGTIAGCSDPRGYRQIRIGKKLYWAHRLAWLYMTGAWPTGEVDHINGDKSNNAFSNLRDGTKSQNMQNLRGPMCSNKTSGLLGAHWSHHLGKWKSSITVNGQSKYLGLFPSAEDAHAAYLKAKRISHKGCTI